MNSSVKLKVKNGSTSALISLESNSTIRQLIDEIRKVTNVDCDDLNLLIGFPPKPIIQMDLETKISEVKIVSGDCIILEKVSNGSVENNLNDKEEDNCEVKRAKLDVQDNIVLTDSLIQCQENLRAKILTKQTIPSDNSCLFASVFYCLHDASLVGFDSHNERQMVCATLLSQPDLFDIEFLDGKTPEQYCDWIMDSNRWGGSVELQLLSALNEVEIDVVNIQSDRVDRFGEDRSYSKRILVLYDGIHYDSIASEDVNTGQLQTRFDIGDEQVVEQGRQLARELRSSNQFTNVASFNIQCRDCLQVMVGESAVRCHAAETGHSNFGEITADHHGNNQQQLNSRNNHHHHRQQ